MEGVVYECPFCGTRDPYFTAEHRLSPAGTPPGDELPPPGTGRRLRPRADTLWRIIPTIVIVLAVLAVHPWTHAGELPFSL